ncbi:MAG TPA: glycosyltransferase [Candidatus Thermoplasmatota archaeon]|nr:glycosyltransferase [Candidatus Thermoplasmatota archaeon]
MRVDILCPDLASNCLGRAHVLGRLLQGAWDVRIVGPCTAPQAWEPLRSDRGIPLVPIPMPATAAEARPGDGRRVWAEVEGSLDAEVVYVSKPFHASLAAARSQARRTGAALLLDIDDTETGILWESLRHMPARDRLRFLGRHQRWHHREPWNVLLGAAEAGRVPHRSVSNRFLQRRHGGVLLPHARDPGELDPARHTRARSRADLGLPAEAPLVLFLGTPRPTKGLETLLAAMSHVPREAMLAIVGLDATPYSRKLASAAAAALGTRAVLRPPVPFSQVPDWLAAADVVAIPQESNRSSRGQMPAKVFDAMSMARPIVATQVSDLPEVLEGCARLVPPGDPSGLGAALRDLLSSPGLAAELGKRARARLVERYSLQAVAPQARQLVQDALAARE